MFIIRGHMFTKIHAYFLAFYIVRVVQNFRETILSSMKNYKDMTNEATPQAPLQDGDKFMSSSILVYTVRDDDHTKTIFCEAVNIEGRQKVKSTVKSLYIQCRYYLPYSMSCLYYIVSYTYSRYA